MLELVSSLDLGLPIWSYSPSFPTSWVVNEETRVFCHKPSFPIGLVHRLPPLFPTEGQDCPLYGGTVALNTHLANFCSLDLSISSPAMACTACYPSFLISTMICLGSSHRVFPWEHMRVPCH